MSTKVSIKRRAQEGGQPGFHLDEDVFDEMGATEGTEQPVYLRLDGVAVELRTLEGGGASVTVALPRELARELGLLPAPAATRKRAR